MPVDMQKAERVLHAYGGEEITRIKQTHGYTQIGRYIDRQIVSQLDRYVDRGCKRQLVFGLDEKLWKIQTFDPKIDNTFINRQINR